MNCDCDFKIGDCIKKVMIDNQIFKIVDLKEIKGGNWHDGFSLTFIATIEKINNTDTDLVEEYCIQYINYMCQINNAFVNKI